MPEQIQHLPALIFTSVLFHLSNLHPQTTITLNKNKKILLRDTMKTKISEINPLFCPWIYHSKITSCSLREGVVCTDTFHCDQQLWDAVDKELQPSLQHRTAATDRGRNRARWRSRRLLHGLQLGTEDKTPLLFQVLFVPQPHKMKTENYALWSFLKTDV